ncbi:MAG: ubiquinol-cytochrome c reductase iron-sulfur subunit [Gammaproteobacteria bacterium]|nr:MAG: ubiquinol-cytochrome c reductase iron-sulfur subunit [Gammaproteobacteria bacterium]
MAKDNIDTGRRKALTIGTAVVGGIGTVAAFVPFVASMNPSASALAAGAPVEVDVSKMEPGQQIQEVWRRKPVWIIRRTPEMIGTLSKLTEKLRDPNSEEISQQPAFAQNEIRSINDEFLVLIGICTHLGCAPEFKPIPGEVGATWLGGFYCACHGSRFDLAGRVYKNVPANKNLEVPPYHFISENRILIGMTEEEAKA